MGIFKNQYENIDFEEIGKKEYERELKNNNNFSYWYPKVKDCGIKMAKAWFYTIPYGIWDKFRSGYEYKKDRQPCIDWVSSIIKQNKELSPRRIYNIKNGCFSNKFNAEDCNAAYYDIPNKFLNIQFASFEYETGGMCEFVIREYIPFDWKETLTIYNGLPLRPEFRVFVDFDTEEILYVVNYWDYDYCKNGMYVANDKLVFDTMANELNDKYFEHKDTVTKLVQENLIVHNSKQTDRLKGKWSVDIMLEENSNTFYLIDMAIAQRSAYWNPNRNDYKEGD